MGGRVRAVLLSAAAVTLTACAGAAQPPAGSSWLHPSVGQGQLEGETVVVLPVGAVEVVDGAVPSDDAAAALAVHAGEAIAGALEAGGGAGFAIRPVRAIVALGLLSESQVDSLYEPLTREVLDAPRQGGEIPEPEAAGWRDWRSDSHAACRKPATNSVRNGSVPTRPWLSACEKPSAQ